MIEQEVLRDELVTAKVLCEYLGWKSDPETFNPVIDGSEYDINDVAEAMAALGWISSVRDYSTKEHRRISGEFYIVHQKLKFSHVLRTNAIVFMVTLGKQIGIGNALELLKIGVTLKEANDIVASGIDSEIATALITGEGSRK